MNKKRILGASMLAALLIAFIIHSAYVFGGIETLKMLGFVIGLTTYITVATFLL